MLVDSVRRITVHIYTEPNNDFIYTSNYKVEEEKTI